MNAMIKCLIIDDEPDCITHLSYLLKTYHNNEVEVLGTYNFWEEARSAIFSYSPDLLFLDIEMAGKKTIDFLPTLGKNDFQVVFTTAHLSYAVKAFGLNAAHYLCKPIDGDELAESIRRVMKVTGKNIDKGLQRIEEKQERALGGLIALPLRNGENVFVALSAILRCESNKGCIEFYVEGDKKYTLCSKATFEEFEKKLSIHSFYRIHESHIVNLKQINSYDSKDGVIQLKDATTIPVADRRRSEFKKRISGIFQ